MELVEEIDTLTAASAVDDFIIGLGVGIAVAQLFIC